MRSWSLASWQANVILSYPMEKAFHDLGNDRLAQTEHLHADWTLECGYSLSRAAGDVARVEVTDGKDFVWRRKVRRKRLLICAIWNAERTKAIGEQVAAMAQDGLRVLGVARGVFGQQTLPGNNTTSRSSSWASWVWPTRYDRPSLLPWKSATRRASES